MEKEESIVNGKLISGYLCSVLPWNNAGILGSLPFRLKEFVSTSKKRKKAIRVCGMFAVLMCEMLQ